MERLPEHAAGAAAVAPGPPAPGLHAPTLVGVGASAGGLKALQQFFGAVRADSGMAYVVIVHLDPSRESRMAELLQDRAAIPVTQVNGPTPIEANHAYLIPPDKDLTVEGTTLSVRDRGERSQHAPVDLFFRTLADAYGAHAMGVVLSGTGADGTMGIRCIREAGGVTIAQSPDEAEHGGMPSSAVATGLVDRVLPVAAIPEELSRLRWLPDMVVDAETPDVEKELARLFAIVRTRTGHDFSRYKRSTVLRRLQRRLRFNHMSALEEYLPLLESSAAECRALMSDLLISVSRFFRDQLEFEALTTLVPGMFETHAPADGVRVWVVGCATGEEAYSVAMVLSEHASTLSDPPRIQVFATDIDERGYATARAGLYTAADVADVAPARLVRFFREEAGGYRITKQLREMVLFAGHNVLHDPPFSRLDLISCRNLFIYLREAAQDQVLETFHFALKPHGLLFLGAAESAGDHGRFTPAVGGTHRLFRRTESTLRLVPRAMAADPLPVPAPERAAVAGAMPARARTAATERFSYGPTHVRLLEQYAPPSVVVNEHLEVVHLSASAGRFLRPAGGVASMSVLSMTSADLRRALRTLLHHALRDGVHVSRRVRTPVDGVARLVNVDVRPALDGHDAGRFALVVFDDLDGAQDTIPTDGPGATGGPANAALEEELSRTRDVLESTLAAHDAAVAELQTVNEELQSINEEQRAASEELETGREEIQAINEELTTINQEHQSTIEELRRTNADLQNLIESTVIGTVFLDRSMRLRRFTPAAAAIFNFLPADQGRPLSHITHALDYPALEADIAAVLATLQPVQREVVTTSGVWYVVRINPYRSFDGENEGAVLTFVDNTEQYRARQEVLDAKRAAEAASTAKSNFLSSMSHEFRTPLNAMVGYAGLLQLDGRLSEPQDQWVERIKVAGWHLATMIDEILSVAKLDAGYEVVETARVDARVVAREAAMVVEPSADSKGLALVLELPDEPVPVVTDAGKARQVLINLCSNAVKYTATGEVRLRLRGSADKVVFEVRDTGIGIAAEHLPHIFERFWQVETGPSRTAEGMGIGLAAAQEYAHLLRGEIEVWSEPGRGSTFTLCLPVNYDRR
jgi:two-component system, chemotaxis family, CheB/CheR fusion protein